jgi:hypothetical protein
VYHWLVVCEEKQQVVKNQHPQKPDLLIEKLSLRQEQEQRELLMALRLELDCLVAVPALKKAYIPLEEVCSSHHAYLIVHQPAGPV